MTTEKFDQTHRRAVIRRVEEALGVSLKPVGKRRKWLADESGRSYWILGGYGAWHGIPEEMMDSEVEMPSDGFLVIAMRQKSAMQVHVGPLKPFVAARANLYRASQTTGDYQFTYRKRGTHITIDQIPSVSLADLTDFEYSADMKESDQRVEEAQKLFESMTSEEKREFLGALREQVRKGAK